MLKKILLSSSILAFSVFSFAEDKLIAKIDGKDVFESEIKEKITAYAKMNGMSQDGEFKYDSLNKEMKDEIVKNMIFGELILKEAQKAKINETSDYKNAIAFAEKQIVQKVFLEQLIKKNVTEEKLKKKYAEISASQASQDEYKARHILVKTEEEAKNVKQKLDKGADFVTLAKEYSTDGTKNDGGELGYFTKGQMVPAFEEATASLKINQISGPVKTDFGYHIIQLEDKRKVKPASFEEMRAKIYENMAAEFVMDYLEQLKTQNKVELF